MKKFCLQDYIDIENDRCQEFERTKNDIMSESVLVSGYYVDDGSETIKDGEPVFVHRHIKESMVEEFKYQKQMGRPHHN